jgi:hypothetical protein
MTGQITGHQPSREAGGAEHHHIQLTIPAHPLILDRQAQTNELICTRPCESDTPGRRSILPNSVRCLRTHLCTAVHNLA